METIDALTVAVVDSSELEKMSEKLDSLKDAVDDMHAVADNSDMGDVSHEPLTYTACAEKYTRVELPPSAGATPLAGATAPARGTRREPRRRPERA